jgi:hypothetical protein
MEQRETKLLLLCEPKSENKFKDLPTLHYTVVTMTYRRKGLVTFKSEDVSI